MIESFDGKTPRIASSTFVHDSACIIGDVVIGENCSIWPMVVIRGDTCSIIIGNNTQIEDGSVIHGNEYVNIGDRVVIGHNATVEAEKVGSNVLIGNGATILLNVEIGDWCIIAASAMVKAGMKIPGHSLVAGVPATVKGEITPEREGKISWFLYPREFVEKYK